LRFLVDCAIFVYEDKAKGSMVEFALEVSFLNGGDRFVQLSVLLSCSDPPTNSLSLRR
jgi:hypothetical protein